MRNILRFLGGIGLKWWTLMSCAVFTFIAFYVAYEDKHNDWLVKTLAAAAVVMLVVAAYLFYLDEYRLRRKAERDRDAAIDRDRPEVFATLSFGPGRSGTRSIGLQNCGVKDARNVQILPTRINEKELTFPHFSRLPRRDEAEYPMLQINGIVDIDKEGEFGFFLRNWCQKWGQAELEFELEVTWFDSSGNPFRSRSHVHYELQSEKCRTRTGFIERVPPKPSN